MSRFMQPSLTTKPDILEKEVWWAFETKRRSTGSNIWRSLPENSIVNYNSGFIQESQCTVTQCEQMGCTSDWAGTNHYYCSGCVGCRQGLHQVKARSGNEMKRVRSQAVYELSPDLLEKQVEMLERKYGGAKARRAALIIQRAFRRYKLLNKFAAITAMAKAEKRLSRRFQVSSEGCSSHDWSPSHHQYHIGASSPYQQPSLMQARSIDSQLPCEQCNFDPELVIRNNFAALYRELRESNIDQRPPRPIRSMSMRERRGGSVDHTVQLKNVESENYPPQLPRSQSAGVQHQQVVASEVELGDMPSYSQFEEYYVHCNSTSLAPCSHHSHVDYSTKEKQEDAGCVKMSIPPISKTMSSSSEWGPQGNKKVPPEVPKRTTSILSRSRSNASPSVVSGHSRGNSFANGSMDTASLSSSDSSLSLSTERSDDSVVRESQVWKRKTQNASPEKMHSTGEKGELEETQLRGAVESQTLIYKVSETLRKRQYRVGLNLFNKKPERGITHLIRRGFLENSPQGVARFLITRKGLSKQMIGEYLGTLQEPFNMAVLECFAQELDLHGMHIDVALRKFQTHFRMPGEAQKIERLMEVFGQRYCFCNKDVVSQFSCADTVFVLAFAIIMLNTDLHTPNLKPERRMKLEDFIKNLRGIDDGNDIDRDLLVGIYERVKNSEFKPGSDHVTQVMKVQSTIGGKKPNLAQAHRRLVCYCRLYEIPDVYKKERPGVHQREVFLFNDLLVITKIFSKKKSSVTYSFRQSFTLCGMMVSTFETQYYSFGIKLSQRLDSKVLIMFNARNEHDRCKFAEDLRESICEMDEMENIRIDAELERQKSGRRRAVAENRDSGVADVEVSPSNPPAPIKETSPEPQISDARANTNEGLKRSALSNSLLDIHEQCEKPQRRGSVGSLDSGMSISFQSTSASTVSRDSSPQNIQPSPKQAGPPSKMLSHQQSFLGSLFSKKERKASRDDIKPFCRSTEV